LSRRKVGTALVFFFPNGRVALIGSLHRRGIFTFVYPFRWLFLIPPRPLPFRFEFHTADQRIQHRFFFRLDHNSWSAGFAVHTSPGGTALSVARSFSEIFECSSGANPLFFFYARRPHPLFFSRSCSAVLAVFPSYFLQSI